MKGYSRLLVGIVFLSAAVLHVQAGPIQLNTGGTAHTENFDTLMNSGSTGGGSTPLNSEILNAQFWTGTAGADISTGWWNGSGTSYGTATDGLNANSSRLLSLGANGAAERALGLGWRQDGGVNMTIGAQLQNATGGAITNLQITYDGEFWYHGALSARGDLTFDYSLNAASIRDTAATWIPVSALNFTPPGQGTGAQYTARDGNAAANRVA